MLSARGPRLRDRTDHAAKPFYCCCRHAAAAAMMMARRFACPAVHECVYEPREVPNADKDMSGTVIVRPTRPEWLKILGEMVMQSRTRPPQEATRATPTLTCMSTLNVCQVQITNEAVRRRAATARDASKPLLLEYMADRVDIDEPLFGYLAVTRDQGWMQGYVTCTTFTTWHRGFRWDSLNPCLSLAEPPNDDNGGVPEDATNACKVDADGHLSAELMTEVFGGDPDNEGIVWPRVAGAHPTCQQL